jgi:hypothetical protein
METTASMVNDGQLLAGLLPHCSQQQFLGPSSWSFQQARGIYWFHCDNHLSGPLFFHHPHPLEAQNVTPGNADHHGPYKCTKKKNVQKNINKGSKNHQMDLTSEVSAYIIVIVLMLQK